METSLRYGGDSKSLKIHAKEKYPIGSNAICQLQGELDTKIGAPTCVSAMIRYFYPELSISFGAGVECHRNKKFHYKGRAKKSFQVTTNGTANFNVKGRCTIDEDLKPVSYEGCVEFVCTVFDVKKDQDLRIKLGYDVFDKIPYLQVQENNWTFNTDGNRRWNVRYNL